MLSAASVPAHHKNVTSTIADDEAVLILPTKGRVQVLNEVGTRVWQLIDAERSIGDIVAVVCQEFLVERDHVLRDTLAFLGELLAKGLIEVPDAGNEAVAT